MKKHYLAILGISLFLFGCEDLERLIKKEETKGGENPVAVIGPAHVNIPPDTEDNFPVTGSTYYVATNGNDANLGTEGAPWKTLQYAASRVAAGDLVLVQNGTYNGFDIRYKSGTEIAPIVFKANGTNVVVGPIVGGRRKDNINVEGADFIVIDGFVLNTYDPGLRDRSIRVVHAKGVIVRNNTVGPCGRQCILTSYAPGVKIRNNTVFDAQVEHGIYVSNSATPNDNPVIRGNHVYGNKFSGIQINGDCYDGNNPEGTTVDGIISGALIEGNVVRENKSKGMSLISMQDSVVRNNLIYGNRIESGAAGIHLTDEGGCNKASHRNLVVNNTIIEPRMPGIRINDGAAENVVFNNIIYAGHPDRLPIVDEVGTSHVDADSNLTFHQVVPTGVFVDFAANNFRLVNGSSAINAGKTVYRTLNAPNIDIEKTARPQGAGIDLGSYEYK